MSREPLYIGHILKWADEFHSRRERWPHRNDGPVEGTLELTWRRIDSALKLGNRGLRRGQSLAKLLLIHRKRRHKGMPPILNEDQILKWADSHRKRTGEWPIVTSGAVEGVKGETWNAVDTSLRIGRRGLPGDSSLAQLLESHRGVRNVLASPNLTFAKILLWADEYHGRTGSWPVRTSGAIPGTLGETWATVAQALIVGGRGLRKKISLARLLARERDKRNHMAVSQLTVKQILIWADFHHRKTGTWPRRIAGDIPEAPGETWSRVDAALVMGARGMPGDDSLAKLLARERGARNKQALPKLLLADIRRWARAHFEQMGSWPKPGSGAIPESGGETWAAVNSALMVGGRGLAGGTSLFRLIESLK